MEYQGGAEGYKIVIKSPSNYRSSVFWRTERLLMKDGCDLPSFFLKEPDSLTIDLHKSVR